MELITFIKPYAILFVIVMVLYFIMWAAFGHIPGFVVPLKAKPRRPRGEYITNGLGNSWPKICPECGSHRYILSGYPYCDECGDLSVRRELSQLDGRE